MLPYDNIEYKQTNSAKMDTLSLSYTRDMWKSNKITVFYVRDSR